MARQHIYTVMNGKEPNHWNVVKMERDHDVVEIYDVSRHVLGQDSTAIWGCGCYASNKSTCRHREMVKLFLEEGAVGSRKAYDYDKQKWILPPQMNVE